MKTRKISALVLLVFMMGVQGCFLPLPYNENGSPPISGIVQQRDGRPDPGRRMAVSSRYDDATCSKARASATTDSAGRFALPHTLIRRRGVVLIPPFESFWNSFTLCSATRTDTVMRAIYAGRVGLGSDAPLQTISCYEWVWQGQARMTCTARDEAKVVEGGRWAADGRRGRYRLVLTEEHTRARGFRGLVPRPHAYVLWIEETEAGLPLGARETVRLPIDDNVTALSHVEILERNGRFYATFPGFKKKFMNDFAAAELRFELGPPGQVTKVAGP